MNILRYIERIERLHFLIKRKATGSPKELARKLSVSESSIYLIINNMKELGAPIAYNETRKSYIYYKECDFYFGFKTLDWKEKYDVKGGIYMGLTTSNFNLSLFKKCYQKIFL